MYAQTYNHYRRPDPDAVTRDIKAMAQATGQWSEQMDRAVGAALLYEDEEQIDYLRSHLARGVALDGAAYHPLLPDPDPGEVDQGELILGRLATTSGPVRLRLADLLLHLLIAGPSGTGKSFLIRPLVTQLIERGVVVLIFDTQSEYSDLGRRFGPDMLDIVDVTDCRINPFDGPARMAQRDWVIGPMVNYLRESLFWRDRTTELFRTICLNIYESGTTAITPPTFLDQYQRVPGYKKNLPEAGSLERFATMLRSVPTFRCLHGEAVEAIAQRSRIIDLRQAPNDLRKFLISDLVTKLVLSRPYRERNPLSIVLVFDETSQFFSRESLSRYIDLQESFYLLMLRTARKYGVGVVLSDQLYAGLHRVARADCLTKIALETRDAPSRREIANDLGLDREQEAFLAELSYRSGRRALVQVRGHPYPFLMEVPRYEKAPHLTDKELAARRREAVSRMRWEPIPERGATTIEQERPDLDDKHLRVLKTVACNPFRMQQEHAAAMDIATSTFTTWTKRLREQEFLRIMHINPGGRGKRFQLLLPTDLGCRYLDAQRIQYVRPKGDGSLAHRFFQDRIWRAEKQKGDFGGIEFARTKNGKRVDVGICRPSRFGKSVEYIAYEVVWSEPLGKEVSNLRKDVADGWTRIIFCVRDHDVGEGLSRRIEQEILPPDRRVQVQLLSDFLG